MISWSVSRISASSASVISVIVSILPTVKLVVAGIGLEANVVSAPLIVNPGLVFKTKVVLCAVTFFETCNPSIIWDDVRLLKLNAFLIMFNLSVVMSWGVPSISASSAVVILISALSLRSIIKSSTIDEKLKNSEAYSLSLPSLIVKLGLATNINL